MFSDKNETLQQMRTRIRNEISRNNDLKKEAYSNIDRVLNTNDLVYISLEQLKTLRVGEVVKISDGVEFEKKFENENEMMFHTVMIEGGKFSLHFHNCVEICKVLEGVLIETQRGERKEIRLLNKGDRVIYDVGEKHSMHVKEYTLLEVRFIKNL